MQKLPSLPKQLAAHIDQLSPTTARQYSRRLARFNQHTGVRLSRLSRSSVESYLVYLARERQVSASYQNTCLSALRWAARVTGQAVDLSGLTARRSHRIPRIVSHRDALDVLGRLAGQEYAVAALVYGAGLSLNEALTMTTAALQTHSNNLVIGDRQTVRPAVVKPLLRAYSILASEDGRLFSVNQNTVTQAIKRACELAGLNPIGTRELRNSFAARLFEQGANVAEVAQMMGYKRVGTLLSILDQTKRDRA